MTKLLLALRSATYVTAFVLLWGWLAIRTKETFGEYFALPSFTRWIGFVCFVLGGSLTLWCIIQFFIVGKGTPAPFDAPRVFVKSGPYRFVRNPMYIGGGTVLLAFGLWNTSATMALFTLFFFVLAHLFVLFYEEPALEREFGANYLMYKTAVGRWLPKFSGQAS